MNNIRPKTIVKKTGLKEVVSVTKQQRPNVQILRHDDQDRHIITRRHFSREHLQSGLKSVLPTYVDDNDEELLTQTSSRDVIITPRSDISHEFKENKGSTSRENDKWRSKHNAMAKSFKKPAVRAGAGTDLKCAVMDNKNAASLTNLNDPAHVANSIQKRIAMLSPRIDSFENKSERPQVHKRVSRDSSYDLYKDTIQNQNIPKLQKLKWKTNSQYKIPSNFEEIKQELLEYAQSRKRVESGREMAEETDVKMATKLSKVPIVQTMNKSVSGVEQDIVSHKLASVSDLESAEVLLSERMTLKEIHQVDDVARQQAMSGDLDNDIAISPDAMPVATSSFDRYLAEVVSESQTRLGSAAPQFKPQNDDVDTAEALLASVEPILKEIAKLPSDELLRISVNPKKPELEPARKSVISGDTSPDKVIKELFKFVPKRYDRMSKGNTARNSPPDDTRDGGINEPLFEGRTVTSPYEDRSPDPDIQHLTKIQVSPRSDDDKQWVAKQRKLDTRRKEKEFSNNKIQVIKGPKSRKPSEESSKPLKKLLTKNPNLSRWSYIFKTSAASGSHSGLSVNQDLPPPLWDDTAHAQYVAEKVSSTFDNVNSLFDKSATQSINVTQKFTKIRDINIESTKNIAPNSAPVNAQHIKATDALMKYLMNRIISPENEIKFSTALKNKHVNADVPPEVSKATSKKSSEDIYKTFRMPGEAKHTKQFAFTDEKSITEVYRNPALNLIERTLRPKKLSLVKIRDSEVKIPDDFDNETKDNLNLCVEKPQLVSIKQSKNICKTSKSTSNAQLYGYSEYSEEAGDDKTNLDVQVLPTLDIKRDFVVQKLPNLCIDPNEEEALTFTNSAKNITVIHVTHDEIVKQKEFIDILESKPSSEHPVENRGYVEVQHVEIDKVIPPPPSSPVALTQDKPHIIEDKVTGEDDELSKKLDVILQRRLEEIDMLEKKKRHKKHFLQLKDAHKEHSFAEKIKSKNASRKKRSKNLEGFEWELPPYLQSFTLGCAGINPKDYKIKVHKQSTSEDKGSSSSKGGEEASIDGEQEGIIKVAGSLEKYTKKYMKDRKYTKLKEQWYPKLGKPKKAVVDVACGSNLDSNSASSDIVIDMSELKSTKDSEPPSVHMEYKVDDGLCVTKKFCTTGILLDSVKDNLKDIMDSQKGLRKELTSIPVYPIPERRIKSANRVKHKSLDDVLVSLSTKSLTSDYKTSMREGNCAIPISSWTLLGNDKIAAKLTSDAHEIDTKRTPRSDFASYEKDEGNNIINKKREPSSNIQLQEGKIPSFVDINSEHSSVSNAEIGDPYRSTIPNLQSSKDIELKTVSAVTEVAGDISSTVIIQTKKTHAYTSLQNKSDPSCVPKIDMSNGVKIGGPSKVIKEGRKVDKNAQIDDYELTTISKKVAKLLQEMKISEVGIQSQDFLRKDSLDRDTQTFFTASQGQQTEAMETPKASVATEISETFVGNVNKVEKSTSSPRTSQIATVKKPDSDKESMLPLTVKSPKEQPKAYEFRCVSMPKSPDSRQVNTISQQTSFPLESIEKMDKISLLESLEAAAIAVQRNERRRDTKHISFSAVVKSPPGHRNIPPKQHARGKFGHSKAETTISTESSTDQNSPASKQQQVERKPMLMRKCPTKFQRHLMVAPMYGVEVPLTATDSSCALHSSSSSGAKHHDVTSSQSVPNSNSSYSCFSEGEAMSIGEIRGKFKRIV